MLRVRNGPKVKIERVPGKIETGTITKIYRSENFKGYAIRLENGTQIPISKDRVTFIEGE